MTHIAVLLCGNEKVFDGMVINALSIVKYSKSPIDLFVFTMDLTEQNEAYKPITFAHCEILRKILTNVNPQSKVKLVDCKPYYLETLTNAENQNTQYTPYTFLRLFADRVPEMPPKLIYLDTDTVLFDDIGKLWEENLGRCEYGAVRDYYGCHFFGINYVNTGVLLLNLPRIRETGLFRKALDLCKRKKIFLADQTAVNRLAKGKKILPRKYNEQHKQKKDTVIRHFSMAIVGWFPKIKTRNIKPWNVEQVHNVLKMHEMDDILENWQTLKQAGLPNSETEESK